MIYAFIALSLPADVRDALQDLQSSLPVGRHNAPDTFHITLAYLDKQNPQTLERIHEILSQMRFPRFEVTLRGVDTFGSRTPRILFAGIEPSEPLAHLRDKVRHTAERSGVVLQRGRFRPHVTIARFKPSLHAKDIAKISDYITQNSTFRLDAFTASDVVMYRSTRHQSGATYDPMVSYPLIG